MINNLKLTNFKCFESEEFKLKNLNILYGVNTSGKSTIYQSLLLLKQSQWYYLDKHELILSDSLCDLESVFNKKAKTQNFEIEVDSNKFSAIIDNANIEDVITLTNMPENYKQLPFFKNDLIYISTDRIVENVDYDFSNYKIGNIKFVEEVLKMNNLQTSDIPEDISFANLVEIIMSKMFNNFDIKNPKSYGLGSKAILPIVIAMLSAKENDILIVDNPELCLHPKIQSEYLIKMLAILSMCGTQVILETYSDHIINGLRVLIYELAVYNNDIRKLHDNAIIYSMNKKYKKTEIMIGTGGFFNALDENFVDQIENDLIRLF